MTSRTCCASSASIPRQGTRVLEVWNKIDRFDADQRENLENIAARRSADVPCFLVSAETGEGVDTLLAAIEDRLAATRTTLDLSVDASDGAAISWLHRNSEVLAKELHDGRYDMTVRVDETKRDIVVNRYAAIPQPAIDAEFRTGSTCSLCKAGSRRTHLTGKAASTIPCPSSNRRKPQESLVNYQNTSLLIDGKWRPSASGKTIAVLNPATEEQIGTVAHADRADLDEALAAADKGFKVWRARRALRARQDHAQGGDLDAGARRQDRDADDHGAGQGSR